MNTGQWIDALRGARRSAQEKVGRRGPGPGAFLLVGAAGGALGALAAQLMDPDRGRSRRARYADQATAMARDAGRALRHGGRVARATIAGKSAALTQGHGGAVMPNDAALAGKVETELFRNPDVPKGAINVNAEQGIVVLRGEVPDAAMREHLEHAARKIPGVWEVENLLHLPDEPAPTERATSGSA